MDGWTERNNHFLVLEKKHVNVLRSNPTSPIPGGQYTALARLSRQPHFTVIAFFDDDDGGVVAIMPFRDGYGTCEPGDSAKLYRVFEEWARHADAQPQTVWTPDPAAWRLPSLAVI